MRKLLLCFVCMAAMLAAGTSLKAQEMTMELYPGWTWISYPSTDTLDLATAFGSFTPAAGDYIKSQAGYAEYYAGYGWYGSLSAFWPCKGYMYKSNRTEPVVVTLNIPLPQQMVTTAEPTDITATSAMVGSTVTIGESDHIFARGVCWSTEPMPDVNGNRTTDATVTGSQTVTLNGLTPNTTYYVRAYVATDNGLAYGNQQSFTTESGGGDTTGEGSGTYDDPYNVAAGIDLQGQNVTGWVHGYIVGSVKSGLSLVTSNADINWNTPFDLATNVVIADDVACREISQCIIVNLPAGKPLRTQVNLMNNPGNLGKHLAVLGTLRIYFGQAGLRDSNGMESDFVLEGGNGGFIIDATANPAEGGEVSGGGSYEMGTVCTLTATPNEGYTFNNWTKYGIEVSTEATYSFIVTEDAAYVANFNYNGGGGSGGNHTNLVLNELNGDTKFIEIYNMGDLDLPLEGMYIMKDGTNSIWTADNTIVAPAHGYVLLYSYDVQVDHPEQPLNLFFNSGLSAKKSLCITLFMPDGTVRDEFTRGTTDVWGSWGASISNVAPQSYARTPDGGDWKLADPTPGTANPTEGEDIPQE